MEKYVPHHSVTVNDKDAPWVTPGTKSAIKRNKRVFRKPDGKSHVNKVQRETNKIIDEAKENYHKDLGEKLCDPRSGQKIIWTVHKRLLNK